MNRIFKLLTFFVSDCPFRTSLRVSGCPTKWSSDTVGWQLGPDSTRPRSHRPRRILRRSGPGRICWPYCSSCTCCTRLQCRPSYWGCPACHQCCPSCWGCPSCPARLQRCPCCIPASGFCIPTPTSVCLPTPILWTILNQFIEKVWQSCDAYLMWRWL